MIYKLKSKDQDGNYQSLEIENHKLTPFLELNLINQDGNFIYTIWDDELHELIGALLHIQAQIKKR